MTRFRTGNNHLPVNKCRFSNNNDDKLCNLCDSGDVGDEFHFLLNCSYFNADRDLYIPRYYRTHPNTLKMQNLFESSRKSTQLNLRKFIAKLLKHFQ